MNLNIQFKACYEKLGLNISYYRKKTKITQEKFSELIGCSSHHLSQIETGDAAPSLDLLFQISHILKISIVDLFSE